MLWLSLHSSKLTKLATQNTAGLIKQCWLINQLEWSMINQRWLINYSKSIDWFWRTRFHDFLLCFCLDLPLFSFTWFIGTVNLKILLGRCFILEINPRLDQTKWFTEELLRFPSFLSTPPTNPIFFLLESSWIRLNYSHKKPVFCLNNFLLSSLIRTPCCRLINNSHSMLASFFSWFTIWFLKIWLLKINASQYLWFKTFYFWLTHLA
jgi:hypothetical protein